MEPEMNRIEGSGKAERHTGFFADMRHQWDSFTPGWNCRDFTFLYVGGEWNSMTQRVELELALLGVYLRVTYIWGDDWGCKMRQLREDVIAGRKQPLASFEIPEARHD